jgi:hypothetical protein
MSKLTLNYPRSTGLLFCPEIFALNHFLEHEKQQPNEINLYTIEKESIINLQNGNILLISYLVKHIIKYDKQILS